MMTVEEALALILSEAVPLPPRSTPLEEAAGRVLAEDADAGFDLPPFPNSAVDGFAVQAEALQGASPGHPVQLALCGEASAGDRPMALRSACDCIRIMTGAPAPTGADAVVMKEDVTFDAASMVTFHAPVAPGENIRPRGQDVAAGEQAVAAGTLIRPSEIAMLASLGMAAVMAYPRPRLAIFTTGNELVAPGAPREPGQIYNSNAYMLAAMARAANFEVGLIRHLPDSLEETIAQFAAAAPDHDVILSSGGVSVGEHDHVRPAVEATGSIRFWRVAMKPGKPLVYGRIGESLFFGLPGNPVSSLVSFELFVRPALLRLAGHSKLQRPRVRARLLGALPHRPGREEFARVLTSRAGEEFVAAPHPGQASHMVSSLVGANSLAVIPSEAGSLPAGARVDVLMTEWPEE